MKIYISYFNNVRNMNKYLIPVSTAKWDPKWFRKENGLSFVDKNGVINGIRCNKLVFPDVLWTNLEVQHQECSKDCSKYKSVESSISWCPFMSLYYQYLANKVDFVNLIDWLGVLCYNVSQIWKEDESKFDIVLLVHEKPDRKCAERPILVKWFKEHGITLEEWRKEE